jgi:hypothetical protein
VGIRTSERFVTVVHTASFILSWVLEQLRDLSLLHTASFILCKTLREFHPTSVVEGILVDEMPMLVLLLFSDDTQQLP